MWFACIWPVLQICENIKPAFKATDVILPSTCPLCRRAHTQQLSWEFWASPNWSRMRLPRQLRKMRLKTILEGRTFWWTAFSLWQNRCLEILWQNPKNKINYLSTGSAVVKVCLGIVVTQVVKSYSVPRKVAVDASMSLYQFLIAVRQVVIQVWGLEYLSEMAQGQDGSGGGGQQLTNEAGEITSHLMGMFYRTIRLSTESLEWCKLYFWVVWSTTICGREHGGSQLINLIFQDGGQWHQACLRVWWETTHDEGRQVLFCL